MFAREKLRTLFLLLLTVVISASVFMLDSFRDDDFSKLDSPLYSTISQNIARTGDWLNLKQKLDIPFEGDHPPLVFWATAMNLKLFGESVFTAVLFALLCATGTCVVTFFIGTILKSDIVGFLSAMGLLLTRYVPRIARHNTIEIPLMFFVTLAVLFIILAHKKNRVFYLLFGVSAGLAMLTKGVIGLFPLGICFFAVLTEKKIKDLFNPFLMAGVVIAFLIPGTWLFVKGHMSIDGAWAVLKQYLNFVFNTFEAAGRGETDTRIRLITRIFEFCYLIAPGFILGSYFVARDALKKNRKDLLILFTWVVIFVLAFCVSKWRRGYYLLPMYPALALLFGIGIDELINKNYKMFTVYLFTAFFSGNIVAPFLFPHAEPKTVGDVIFRNTHLPGARAAVAKLSARLGPDMLLVPYGQHDENEFLFFFSAGNKVALTPDDARFEEYVLSDRPVVFYMPAERFTEVDKKYPGKLKVVYAFGKQLFVTNRMDAEAVW